MHKVPGTLPFFFQARDYVPREPYFWIRWPPVSPPPHPIGFPQRCNNMWALGKEMGYEQKGILE